MTAFKVNADYETILFYNQLAPKAVNEAIEPLYLFLNEAPLLTSKKYDPIFLSYIQSKMGHLPSVTSSGKFENWWGLLKNTELEKKLNSKITSAEFLIETNLCQNTFIVDQDSEDFSRNEKFVLKDPFGMSGQKFQVLLPNEPLHSRSIKGKTIMEPFFERVHDFSHYVFPNGEVIAYQNFVDQKFQYKGTFFQDRESATVENLAFYTEVDPSEWQKFQDTLRLIIAHYRKLGATEGFSIDSFTYRENDKIKIRALSEVNYRRTMGVTAFELSQKYRPQDTWSLFVLMRPMAFEVLHERLSQVSEQVIILAPGDTRFSMLLLKASSKEKGQELIGKMNKLLTSGEFPVKIQDDFPSFLG